MNLKAKGNSMIGGDVVGRDKIVNIYQSVQGKAPTNPAYGSACGTSVCWPR